MSDNIKLVIEIPRNEYEYTCERTLSDRTFWDDAIRNGIPLDDVKAEIDQLPDLNPDYPMDKTIHISKWNVMQILDNISKAESEDL